MFYVYILQSKKDNKLYIGYSLNLRERVNEHLKGKVLSTRNRRPMVLIYYEAYRAEKDARVREFFLKTGQGRDFIKKNIIYSRVSAQGANAQGRPASGVGPA
jgi:putative endonuclease